MSHESWLKDVVNPDGLSYCASKLAEEIDKDKVSLGINAIAVTGLSGCVIGGVVSFMTGLPLVLVRKDESKHSRYDVEFSEEIIDGNLNYCIVDDLISSGATIRKIFEKINIENGKRNSNLIKIYLYHEYGGTTEFSIRNDLGEFLFEIPVCSFYGRD